MDSVEYFKKILEMGRKLEFPNAIILEELTDRLASNSYQVSKTHLKTIWSTRDL